MRALLIAALSVALFAATPNATFDPSALQTGQAAAGVPRTDGRPVVIDVFASWCVGCVEEMPRVVADYARFKDRVDFIGVDYLDSSKGGDAVVDKFKIAFPVVRARPDETKPATIVDPSTEFPATSGIHMSGIAPEQFPAIVGTIAAQTKDPALADIAAYCKAHSNSDCVAYAKGHGVTFSGKATPHVMTMQKTASDSNTSSTKMLSLPTLVVIDGNGIVQATETGYDTAHDPIVSELAKLGIK